MFFYKRFIWAIIKLNNDKKYVNNDFYNNNSPNGSYEQYSLSDEDQNITFNQLNFL